MRIETFPIHANTGIHIAQYSRADDDSCSRHRQGAAVHRRRHLAEEAIQLAGQHRGVALVPAIGVAGLAGALLLHYGYGGEVSAS